MIILFYSWQEVQSRVCRRGLELPEELARRCAFSLQDKHRDAYFEAYCGWQKDRHGNIGNTGHEIHVDCLQPSWVPLENAVKPRFMYDSS
jgi:hypothetical protein